MSKVTPDTPKTNDAINWPSRRHSGFAERRRLALIATALIAVLFFVLPLPAEEIPASVSNKQVIDRFWDVLLRSPRRGTTFDRVYGYYADTGHTDLLLERCRELVAQDDRNAKAHFVYGLVLERRGDTVGAAAEFESAAKLDEKDALAPFYLAENFVTLGRLREAIDALEESVRRRPSRVDVRTVMQTLGRVYERFGEPEKSKDVWNRLETLFPDDPELLVQIAETLESEGRLDEALDRFDRLAEKTKDEFARLRFTMTAADLRLRQGKTDEAVNQLGTLLDRLAPESWPAEAVRERIDRIFVREGNLPGLADFYRARMQKHPTEAESIRRLSITLRRIGRSDEARTILEESIAKIPSNVPLRLAMIDFLVGQKEFAATAEQYRQLNELRPGNVDFLSKWGQVVFDNPDTEEGVRKSEAVKIWRRISDAAPSDPVAAVTLADLLVRNRLYEEAEEFYCRAFELRPDDPVYREYLAMFYHTRREKDKVVETLRPMAEGDRRNAESLSQLGVTLLSLGYVEESFEPLRDAAELAPDDLAVQWRFIEALVRHGDMADNMERAAEKIRAAERLIESDNDFDAKFDDFLHREVRFLQSVRKLAVATKALEARLETLPEAERKTKAAARSWWRLALYRQSAVETRPAAEAVEQALAAAPPTPRLLRSAAEIYEQNGDLEKAITLYENLANVDGVWRVEHLKHLAPLQIRVGRMEQALETGRLIMGLGSGNASNIRFYADLLLSIGRREEGIGILRQALRVEPGDVSTLALLAATLADAGRENEAIEITWRLFERTENLSGKLALVEKLSVYYQQSGRFDDLADRLQTRLTTTADNMAGGRQEAALCLARAFSSTAQFEQARQVLENRLNVPDRDDDASTAVLSLRELVSIALRQDDLAGAVRYQEQLVQRSREPRDVDRLFVLYDQAGETEKATDLFLGRVLLLNSLDEKLDGIDRMIGREQYDAVLRIFDFLEIHDSANWQIPWRRIAVESYLGEFSVSELVDDFRRLRFPVPDRSVKRIPDVIRHDRLTLSPPQPWLLPGSNFSRVGLPPSPETFPWVATAPEDFLAALYVQEQFLPTLLRNRLRKNERFSFQGTPPPKPFFRIDHFDDARFLSLAWLLAEAIDEDLKAANSAEDQLERFGKLVADFRAEMPEESPERSVRLERLRLETLLVSLARLDEGRQSLAGGRLKTEVDVKAAKDTMRTIVRRFGLDGEADWQAATLLILLHEILDRQINKAELSTAEFDRLLELWRELARRSEAEHFDRFATRVAVELPKIVWLLETSGRVADAEELRKTVEQIGCRDPVQLARLAPVVSRPFDPTTNGFDTIDTRFDRMKPWLVKARDFGLETDDAELRRNLGNAIMESLSSIFTPDSLSPYEIFSEQEITLIGSSVEEMRDLLNRANQTPSAHFARRLIGLEEYETGERKIVTEKLRAGIDELVRALQRLTDFSFEILDRLLIPAVEDTAAPPGAPVQKLPKPLSSYQKELLGRRMVDRSLLRSVLQGRRFYAPLTKFEEFFYRVAILGRVLDTTLKNVGTETDGRFEPMPTGYADRLQDRLERREQSGSALDRRIVSDLRDILVEILRPFETDGETLDAEYVRLGLRLEEYDRARSERNLVADPSVLLATALLAAKAKRLDDVMPILDRIPLRSPQDVRAREFIAAHLGADQSTQSERRKRGESALDRLLGYRLAGHDSYDLYHLLVAYQRSDDAKAVLDRVIATTTDRQLQIWLLEMLRPPLLHGKPYDMKSAVKMAHRVLRNPAFFADPRYFVNDAHIYAMALNILKEYDSVNGGGVDGVVELLEARYKGFKDKTDGRIMLAELYIVAGKTEEARETVRELVRHPSRESDRRAAITKLLQHFGMRKELEEMNERLLAPIYRPDPPPP